MFLTSFALAYLLSILRVQQYLSYARFYDVCAVNRSCSSILSSVFRVALYV